ncbi:MAG: polyamine aminopropyltransferase [Chryseotalea sp.]
MPTSAHSNQRFQVILLLSVFVVATCGLVYELIAGTLASYLLGDSITQFSTIIGTYLFSMGIGSYISRYFEHNLMRWFIQIEMLVGLVGGFSSTLLYVLFNQVEFFRLLLYGSVVLTGTLVGLELPLLMRILKDKIEFNDLVSKIFTFDYIGALLASLVFPLVCVPYLGILKTSFFFGLLNVGVALWVCLLFKSEIPGYKVTFTSGVFFVILLATGFVLSDRIISFSESLSYSGKIIVSASSPYQRIILTKQKDDLRLFLNGNLQFSSKDEYRYHEALVHPAAVRTKNLNKVLVLGGGDGLAVRELHKYKEVNEIVLVDLDAAVVKLFTTHQALIKLNDDALRKENVSVIHDDAFTWMKENKTLFDLIIIDFPDPSNFSLGKLYSQTFYREMRRSLHPDGLCVVQSTSPYFARQSFWMINQTIASCDYNTQAYHCYLPSFGEWGFIMAGASVPKSPVRSYPNNVKFINEETFQQLHHFPPDMSKVETGVNKLNDQLLVHVFEKEWSAYLHD